jgi:hypothetical protein
MAESDCMNCYLGKGVRFSSSSSSSESSMLNSKLFALLPLILNEPPLFYFFLSSLNAFVFFLGSVSILSIFFLDLVSYLIISNPEIDSVNCNLGKGVRFSSSESSSSGMLIS